MSTTAETPSAEMSGGRRWTVRLLLIFATIFAILAIFAVWADRQLLNADNWADTSSEILQNEDVQKQVSAFLVDQVYANVDVAAELEAGLPPRLRPLAGPIANGLGQVAVRGVDRILERPRVQKAWEEANRLTAEQFIAISKGESRAVTASGDDVVLNLRVLVIDLVERLGLPGKAVGQIPENAGVITVMSETQVSALQDAVNLLDGLALVLPILALGMFALAVVLARGNRRRTLLFVGIDLIAAGLVVLVARGMIGNAVVSSLASTASVEPAAQAVWSIGTDMLRDVAGACIIVGIPIVFAAWIAGPTRPAVAARRWAAPWLSEPGAAYGVLAAVLGLVLLWGPIPATREIIPVLLLIGLSIFGMEVLRRQVAEEFPDDSSPSTPAPAPATPADSGSSDPS